MENPPIRRAKNGCSKSSAAALNSWSAFEAILELTEAAGGEWRTADEVEKLLVEEVRRLGNRAMADWAGQAEQRAGEELRQAVSGARLRKKKP